MIEILKSFGYTSGAVAVLLGLAYLARGFFEALLKKIVADDLERTLQQNRIDLENLKNQYDDELQQKKAALNREIERYKSGLTVQTETFRAAGEKRFKSLLNLWEKSESLLRNTDLTDVDDIKQKLTDVEAAANDLDMKSVLLSPTTANDIHVYLKELKKLYTLSEKALIGSSKQKKSKPNQTKGTPITSTKVNVGGGISFTFDLGSVIKFASKYFSSNKLKVATDARSKLLDALRREFGVLPVNIKVHENEDSDK